MSRDGYRMPDDGDLYLYTPAYDPKEAKPKEDGSLDTGLLRDIVNMSDMKSGSGLTPNTTPKPR